MKKLLSSSNWKSQPRQLLATHRTAKRIGH
ncbi:hypothetical protein E2320_012290, partial [Naja naja]